MRAEALLEVDRKNLKVTEYVTVTLDGLDCLKHLKIAIPQSAEHIHDWFHVTMKLRPVEQTTK